MFDILYYGCSIVNLFVLFYVYLPNIFNEHSERIFLICLMIKGIKSLKRKIIFIFQLLWIVILQMLQSSCVRIAVNEYELRHVINAELIKIKIKRSAKQVLDVKNNHGSLLNDAKPYLLFDPISWKPSEKVTITYKDGTVDVI
jgi:hypothetical protein